MQYMEKTVKKHIIHREVMNEVTQYTKHTWREDMIKRLYYTNGQWGELIATNHH